MGCSASKQPREAPDESEQRAAARRAERERNEKLWQNSRSPQGGMGGGYAHHSSNAKGSSYAARYRPADTPRGGCGSGYGRMSNAGGDTPHAYSVGAPTPRGGCGGDYHPHQRQHHHYRRMGSAYGGGGDSPRAMTAGAPTPRGGCGGGYRRASSAYGGSRPGSVYGVSPRAYSVGAPTPRPHTGRANSYGCQTPQHRA